MKGLKEPEAFLANMKQASEAYAAAKGIPKEQAVIYDIVIDNIANLGGKQGPHLRRQIRAWPAREAHAQLPQAPCSEAGLAGGGTDSGRFSANVSAGSRPSSPGTVDTAPELGRAAGADPRHGQPRLRTR